MNSKQLVIISGVSGSGKSTALNAFEDMGYFCIDNLPVGMIEAFADFLINSDPSKADALNLNPANDKFALLLDGRSKRSFPTLSSALGKLKESGVKVSVFYFDCQDEVVLRRFRETRRPHPLLLGKTNVSNIAEALEQERGLLAEFRAAADKVIDSSAYSPHDLRQAVEEALGFNRSLEVTFKSFGFKYGVPHDADMVIDVRFLPNPYFVAGLSEKNGHDKEVADFVLENPDTKEFLKHYVPLLKFLIPKYHSEGKRYLTVAIGCTGGRHRSVAIADYLQDKISYISVEAKRVDRDLK